LLVILNMYFLFAARIFIAFSFWEFLFMRL